ncbi:MAG: ATP-dependent RNA helicase HrpA [Corynebacteriales bacterium]|nr:ATP-dependent RNA helicase HrpA [Mycobacteriales bacterium]
MTTLADLRELLPELSLLDEMRLSRRMKGAGRIADPERQKAVLGKIENDIARAKDNLARRKAGIPPVSYPEELPVSTRREDIMAAIRDHQVVVVAGETGSGKTTQLPKMCLELGRGVRGTIGHTQPRRLAARAVADRLATELSVELGAAVGYQVRFASHISQDTVVKVMTDGVLLAEIAQDRDLRAYDTLIIDEAHERSLNIDFLLGYLKELLPRRPDLKVIITSATIDPARFARYFEGAPIVEVSGRTYPVEVRYREAEDADLFQNICAAVDELAAEGTGDMLVFLSGEREIRDAAEAIGKMKLANTEVLPLFSRLSAAEQYRIFGAHTGRRIVLATNVAETSLTVPGIRYVIDAGTARISRYSHRLKVQQLPIEPISQASANQRSGRCGRIGPGICIRLYSEDDFVNRSAFTDPEIVRTNLASVILQMAALGLGDIAEFPFLDAPDRRQITAGVRLLHELGALELRGSEPPVLTKLGRQLASLPLDPRLARMLLEADRNGCVREVLVIVAALSVIDPRERPTDAQQQAQEKHARFTDPQSDFSAFLNLWNYVREQRRVLTSSQFRKLCKSEFLNYLRIREWQDIVSQLRQVLKGLDINETSAPESGNLIHQALLPGLLSHIGLREGDKKEYLGARGAKFAIAPGSGLFKKPPRWTMVAELVETKRLWGRVAARIEPEWVEPLAGHLVVRSYSEPRWEKRQGSVVATERVTLFGVPIVTGRKVGYGRIDAELSRELFIRHALIAGEWRTHHTFARKNAELLEEASELEQRLRRRDIVVDDEVLFDFYDQRLPADIVSARHFDAWWKTAKRTQPELLNFDLEMLLARDAEADTGKYPDHWRVGDIDLAVSYEFHPGEEHDGVTVTVPLPVLNQVPPEPFTWQVPGLRAELVTSLLRSLPKDLRRPLVPIPDTAAELLRAMTSEERPLLDALIIELRRRFDLTVTHEDWQIDRVPKYLQVTFRVISPDGDVLGQSKDLAALKEKLSTQLHSQLVSARSSIEQSGLRAWTFDALPGSIRQRQGSFVTVGYPALVDDGDSVSIRLMETEQLARDAMWAGTRRLLALTTGRSTKQLISTVDRASLLGLTAAPGGAQAILEDCQLAAIDSLLSSAGGPVWDEPSFAALRAQVMAGLPDAFLAAIAAARKIVDVAPGVFHQLAGVKNPALASAVTDMRAQLDALVYPGFVTDTGLSRLADVHRYVRAIAYRLEKLPGQPGRDSTAQDDVEAVVEEYQQWARTAQPAAVREVRWMIEELRVSLFAQAIGAAYKVSAVRIYRAMDEYDNQN